MFGLLDPRDITKSDCLLIFGQHLGAALAKRHGLAPAHLHLAHEEHPDADQEQHREPLDQDCHIPRIAILGPGAHPHALLAQGVHQLRIVRRKGGKAAVVAKAAVDRLSLYGDLGDFPALESGKEIAERDLGLWGLLAAEYVEQQENHESQHQP